jgi:hypothetical protein
VVFGQPFTFGWRAQESVTLPLYYQDVSPEPNGEQTSLEIHTVPFTLGKKTEVFVDVKGTLIVRQTGTPVAVPSPVSLDGRCVLGVDFGGERGKLRLFYRLDRTTDPEVDDNPVPSVTSTLGVEAIFQ